MKKEMLSDHDYNKSQDSFPFASINNPFSVSLLRSEILEPLVDSMGGISGDCYPLLDDYTPVGGLCRSERERILLDEADTLTSNLSPLSECLNATCSEDRGTNELFDFSSHKISLPFLATEGQRASLGRTGKEEFEWGKTEIGDTAQLTRIHQEQISNARNYRYQVSPVRELFDEELVGEESSTAPPHSPSPLSMHFSLFTEKDITNSNSKEADECLASSQYAMLGSEKKIDFLEPVDSKYSQKYLSPKSSDGNQRVENTDRCRFAISSLVEHYSLREREQKESRNKAWTSLTQHALNPIKPYHKASARSPASHTVSSHLISPPVDYGVSTRSVVVHYRTHTASNNLISNHRVLPSPSDRSIGSCRLSLYPDLSRHDQLPSNPIESFDLTKRSYFRDFPRSSAKYYKS